MNSRTRGTSSRFAGRIVIVSLMWLSCARLSCDALQPLRNPARAREQRLEEIAVAAAAGTPALQQVYLHEVHRIDVGIAQADGSLQRRLAVEQLRAALEGQDPLARQLVFGADLCREPP